ncbi:hypothetical protein NXX64_00025 [Bacteroides fragilis]|nr:hypothetical protein [Bacteroides fragilis]
MNNDLLMVFWFAIQHIGSSQRYAKNTVKGIIKESNLSIDDCRLHQKEWFFSQSDEKFIEKN